MVVEAQQTMVLKGGVSTNPVNPDLNFRLRLDIGGANIRIADKLITDKETERFYVDRESGLDMDFEIVKSWSGPPNESKITIWNLYESTYTNIMQNANAFELYAAWSNDEYNLMFRGYPMKALKKAKGTILTSNQGFLKQDANAGRRGQNDLETVITLIDGKAQYETATIAREYKNGVSTETIFNEVVATFGVAMGTMVPIKHKIKQNYTAYGKSTAVLNKLAKELGFNWKIINGIFYTFTDKIPDQPYGIFLNSNNSSTPERQNDTFKSTKKGAQAGAEGTTAVNKTYNGYMIKTKLLPWLNPGLTCFCNFGERLQGSRFIYKVKHRGNNYGTVAETEVYVV